VTNKMAEMSNLAKVIYKRTYARKDFGVIENWTDTVERAIGGNVRGHKVEEKEIEQLRYLLLNRKAGPAGRGWWFSGAPAHTTLGGAALNNCWYLTSEEWMNFVIAQDLSMLGGGVGMSVEHKYTSKLPKVKKGVVIRHKNTKDASFIVPDSREGWCELTRRVLESYFVSGKSFEYSTTCVRGAGESINGFGGVASGPIPLISLVEKLSSIFTNREGRKLRPIDALDVLCCIGEMVVSGNVRRSALMIIGDAFDKDFLTAKRWDLANVPTQRAMANLSVIADDIDDLHPLFWKTYEHGEPFGLINRTNIQTYGRMGELKPDTATGVNPCLPPWATVLTPHGIKTIGDVNEGDIIWSGKQWTKITAKWSTGTKMVLAYHTRAGTFFGTENHRIVQNGQKIEVKEAEAIDTSQGPDTEILPLNPQDIMNGLVLGDGTEHKASNLVALIIGTDDQDYFTSEIKDLIKQQTKIQTNGSIYKVESMFSHLPRTYDREVPKSYRFGSFVQARGFLRGLYTANGSVVGSRVALKASSFKIIEVVQEMLSALGIRSYYTTNKAHDVEFKNGIYSCKESYDLNISTDRTLFRDLIGFIHTGKMERLNAICTKQASNKTKMTYEVVSVTNLQEEEVFDLTVEAEEHTFWTGGLLVSNCSEACLEDGEPCNLQELALPNLAGIEEFESAARLMHRWGKRVTMEKYHIEKSEEVVKRNRRVGTGITGCLQSPLFVPETLDRVYAALEDENRKYSKELGINESIRLTVIKPSGTLSKLFDMHGYEGIHAAWSEYMIQRIRFGSNDPAIPKLLRAGHHIEPVVRFDGTLDHNTSVVDFYEQAPAGAPVADKNWSTWKQLDVVKMVQKHWADQSVSVTVYYKKEEIPQLKAWLKDNLKYLKTISFLCHSDHGFKQAPKEAITKEQFEKLSSAIKPIEVDELEEGEAIAGSECEGGTCPLR